MERYELDTRWGTILELTKQSLPEPIWVSTIQSGLIPSTFNSATNTLQLMVMQTYKKMVIEQNPLVFNALLNAVRQTFGETVKIEILDMSIPEPPIEEVPITTTNASVETPSANNSIAVKTSPQIMNTTPMQNSMTDIQKYKTSMYDDPVVISAPNDLRETSMSNTEGTTHSQSDINHSASTEEYIDLSPSHLNPSFTFDTFVVGNPNRMAYAAATSVAESPAKSYNPLFIYGPSGLGKTHLMHAIGNRILECHPELKVMCITSEGMTNLYVKSVRVNDFEMFRQTFRNVDVLLVDDIQFIQNKASTSEEFFHTFNILMDEKKQIVLTSDTLPKNMPQLHDRLRTRFQDSFIATIDPPDMEMRMGIFQKMLSKQTEQPYVTVSDEVIGFVTSQFNDSIRPMQGAIKQLLEVAKMDGVTNVTDINYVRRAIANSLPDSNAVYLTTEGIQDFVAEYFRIKKADLLGPKRNKQFAIPRQISMYLCRELLNESFPQIGLAFGKDHSTIIHAHSKIYKGMEKDDQLRHQVEDIIEKIRSRG